MEENVKEWALDQGYEEVKYLGRWKNFEVYDLLFNEDRVVGFPLCALVYENKIRVSTPEESIEIINFFEEEKSENSSESEDYKYLVPEGM